VAHRRRAGGFRSGPKNNIWTSVLTEEEVVGTTPIENNIVQASDWTPANSGFERGTLLRIRGWLTVTASPVTAPIANFFAVIYLTDESNGVVDFSLLASYQTEDVLWTWGGQFAAGNAAAVEGRDIHREAIIDVKSMRKVTVGQQVRLSVVADTGSAVSMSGLIRGLMRKGGN